MTMSSKEAWIFNFFWLMKEFDRKKLGLRPRRIPVDESATWTRQKNSIASLTRTRNKRNRGLCGRWWAVSCYGVREVNYTTIWRQGHDINDLCFVQNWRNEADDLRRLWTTIGRWAQRRMIEGFWIQQRKLTQFNQLLQCYSILVMLFHESKGIFKTIWIQ